MRGKRLEVFEQKCETGMLGKSMLEFTWPSKCRGCWEEVQRAGSREFQQLSQDPLYLASQWVRWKGWREYGYLCQKEAYLGVGARWCICFGLC